MRHRFHDRRRRVKIRLTRCVRYGKRFFLRYLNEK